MTGGLRAAFVVLGAATTRGGAGPPLVVIHLCPVQGSPPCTGFDFFARTAMSGAPVALMHASSAKWPRLSQRCGKQRFAKYHLGFERDGLAIEPRFL